MKRMAIVGVAGFMFASSLAFGQDPLPIKDLAPPTVDVGPVLCATDIYGTHVECSQAIDMNGEYYRYWYHDVDSAFDHYQVSGCVLMSATLTIAYGDVDFYDQPASNAELDVVQFGDGALDVLKGYNETWEKMSWDVRTRFNAASDDTIPFNINVDAAHTDPVWAVYLDKATLNTNWCCNCQVAKDDTIAEEK